MDKKPSYRVGNYQINLDRLLHDIVSYNEKEYVFTNTVNQMMLDIEAIDELVKCFPKFIEANFVINCIKNKE